MRRVVLFLAPSWSCVISSPWAWIRGIWRSVGMRGDDSSRRNCLMREATSLGCRRDECGGRKTGFPCSRSAYEWKEFGIHFIADHFKHVKSAICTLGERYIWNVRQDYIFQCFKVSYFQQGCMYLIKNTSKLYYYEKIYIFYIKRLLCDAKTCHKTLQKTFQYADLILSYCWSPINNSYLYFQYWNQFLRLTLSFGKHFF